MEISERKTKILRAVIDDYIENAEPISSKEIKDKHLPELSSATIRSELSALEEMGYLVQPHISSGRVPSAKAYKLYVEKLMSKRNLSAYEINYIDSYLDGKVNQVEDLLRRTARVVSDITNYTSVILLKKIENVRIKEVKLLDLTDNTLLVIIITDSGIIKDSIITVPEDIGPSYIDAATVMLNNIFAGRTVGEAQYPKDNIDTEMTRFRGLFDKVLEAIKKHSDNNSMYLEGGNKILNYPEYNDIGKAKNFLSLVDTKEKLYTLLATDSDIEISFKIDKTGEQGMDEYSVVTAKYSINGEELGQLGVIGPTRMNYDKVYSVLKYINKTLNEGGNNGGKNG